MKSPKQITITALKAKDVGDFPSFIHLGHRHIQKERPPGVSVGGALEFILPLDLIRMTVNPSLLGEIDEVRIAYKK